MKIPSTTVEFLDAIKALRGLTSDYQLFKALGWGQTTISKYRVGSRLMSSEHGLRVADELGLPRAYVLACIEAERERNEQVAGVWRELAAKLRRSAAAIILIGLGVGLGSGNAYADSVSTQLAHAAAAPDIYYGKSRRRRRWRLRTLILSLLEALDAAAQPVTAAAGLL